MRKVHLSFRQIEEGTKRLRCHPRRPAQVRGVRDALGIAYATVPRSQALTTQSLLLVSIGQVKFSSNQEVRELTGNIVIACVSRMDILRVHDLPDVRR